MATMADAGQRDGGFQQCDLRDRMAALQLFMGVAEAKLTGSGLQAVDMMLPHKV